MKEINVSKEKCIQGNRHFFSTEDDKVFELKTEDPAVVVHKHIMRMCCLKCGKMQLRTSYYAKGV